MDNLYSLKILCGMSDNHFIIKKDEFENTFFIATPEKALLDFFYFKMRHLTKIDADIFSLSFRLQNVETLDNQALLSIAKQFSSKKLDRLVQLFIDIKDRIND